jgi:hypothetical protein
MPSRQERRRAERDAAKRAPAQGGAARAAKAARAADVAAALAHLDMNAGGDWTTQTEDPFELVRALGSDMRILKQRADGEGDRQGLTLVHFPAQL